MISNPIYGKIKLMFQTTNQMYMWYDHRSMISDIHSKTLRAPSWDDLPEHRTYWWIETMYHGPVIIVHFPTGMQPPLGGPENGKHQKYTT